MDFLVAPLQGYTDVTFRRLHQQLYPTPHTTYFTPFVRLEKGALRRRDINDITANSGLPVCEIPQIIFRDNDEFTTLVNAISDLGHTAIDLNMGCPFPMQTRKGRGAALIGNPTVLSQIADSMHRRPDITFSVKMRLGANSPDQWQQSIDILNHMPLSHITLHPRIADQLYGGECHFDQAHEFISRAKHPIIYNGDITSPADIHHTVQRFPQISGVMIGRGLIARPSLIDEYLCGNELQPETLLSRQLQLHDALLADRTDTLCGDTQILSKIKPFWDFSENIIGRKYLKTINKASSLTKYIRIIDEIRGKTIARNKIL